MKIAVAQTKPVTGNIESNINNHITLINLAASNGADIIIFPELSLTGYEPSLAKELATGINDSRFDVFQKLSNEKQITIGAGVPTSAETGINITMVLFEPNKPRQANSKMYLHEDEEPFFVSGENLPGLYINNTSIALAICYEISIPQHAEKAHKTGAQLYVASVAKTVKGVEKAWAGLSETAGKYGMTVLMSNSVGMCEDGLCGGKSAAWNSRGELLGHLNDTDEGIIVLDTDIDKIYLFIE
ncbi:MAG TPA: carbon-nitrogen hydrolase family protein [Niastella sp.]